MHFPAFALLLLGAVALPPVSSNPGCPFVKAHEANKERRLAFKVIGAGGDGGTIPSGGFAAVKEEIKKVLVDSKEFWPADFGNYGPFMIRLAWHCSGSFRRSDGRGGCDGGRIRFDPEMNWPDNANLDMALLLLEPIKKKFGSDLSWGDLIILTGNTAIESMGGPTMGFCGGRVDNADGLLSVPLGPSQEQSDLMPCEVNGQCEFPLGPTTVGLIYVNPAGPSGNPDQTASAIDVRNAFGNMGFDDAETVSLIGGGHAFGKCHGACKNSSCESLAPDGNPGTVTSGFEGQWTSTPTTWSNEYFKSLLGFEWKLTTSPHEQPQWKPFTSDGSAPPDNVLMTTADLALIRETSYLALVNRYASDISALEQDFAASWYRLTSQDMGPQSRCIGETVPSPQPFQQPIPDAPETDPANYILTRAAIQAKLDDGTLVATDLIRLAFQCASTYRSTDFSGGCNGARIRFPPESDWPVNAGLDYVVTALSVIKKFDVSMADVIVLAGQTAMEMKGGDSMTFCGGRGDAENAAFSDNLAPRDYVASPTLAIRDNFDVMGLTARQGVALYGRPSSRYPELGSLFTALTTKTFEDPNTDEMFVPVGGGSPVTEMEFALTQDTEYLAIVEAFVEDNISFKSELASAWTYLMTADRFSGPTTNACTGVNQLTLIGGLECFSGQMTVELENKSTVPLRLVQVGDRVKVDDGKYEPIYAFGHKNAEASSVFLQITTENNRNILEISKDHMVTIEGSRSVPASMVKLGDKLVTGAGDLVAVKTISNVFRKGIYAPFTYSGTIEVNGVKASTYVSLQEDAEFLTIGNFETPFSHQWLSHSVMLPFRLLGSNTIFSAWAEWLQGTGQHLLTQHPIILGLSMVPLVGFLGITTMLETLWLQPGLVVAVGLIALSLYRINKSSTKAL